MRKKERGQAIVLVVLATCLVLIGGIGLAIDVAQLYGQRHMAQVAADAAALGGIMSIFDHTWSSPFTDFTCTVGTDGHSPCQYARQNGFDTTSSDQVDVSFPASVPGVSLSSDYPTNVVKVIVSRNVNNWFTRLVGAGPITVVKATATAAIVDVVAPVPIIVLHPTLSGSFQKNGSNTVTICGGPSRSIQVNSNSGTSISISGVSGTVDLSHAGPLDPGDCTTGTGADFGNYAPGPPPQRTYPGTLLLGTKPGKYIEPSSPIGDPLLSIPAPAVPANAAAKTPLANGINGCPAAPLKACNLYYPGNYPSGINVQNETAVFSPGIYYMSSGGFGNAANGVMLMATGVGNDTATGTNWSAGHMLVYNTGNGINDVFSVGANSGATLNGAPAGVTAGCTTVCTDFKGILFFQDRGAAAHIGTHSHSLGGGGSITLTGTLYMTNTVATMSSAPAHYQALSLQGNPGSSTTIIGEIIVDTLSLGGNAGIMMNLNPAATLHISQVALVN